MFLAIRNPMHFEQARRLSDPALIGLMGQDASDLVVQEIGAEERSEFVFGEAVLAGRAAGCAASQNGRRPINGRRSVLRDGSGEGCHQKSEKSSIGSIELEQGGKL